MRREVFSSLQKKLFEKLKEKKMFNDDCNFMPHVNIVRKYTAFRHEYYCIILLHSHLLDFLTFLKR